MNNLTKKYFHLKELCPVVNMKYRQLQTKIKIVSEEYKDRKDLLYKEHNKWYIHHSIIKDFKRSRKPINYILYATIASKNQFDAAYWKFIIFRLNKTLKRLDRTNRIKYVIETTKNNTHHIHFITSFDKLKVLKKIIKEDDLTNNTNDMNTKIKYVWEVKGLHNYFKKQNKPVLLR